MLAIGELATLLVAVALLAIRGRVWPATLPTLRDALSGAAMLVSVVAAVVLATGLADLLARVPVRAALLALGIPSFPVVTALFGGEAREVRAPGCQCDGGERRKRSSDRAE